MPDEESREVAEGDSDFEYAYEALQLELMQLRRCAVSLGLVRVVEDLHAHHDRLVHTLVAAVRKDERGPYVAVITSVANELEADRRCLICYLEEGHTPGCPAPQVIALARGAAPAEGGTD